jgi:hypothetical protein
MIYQLKYTDKAEAINHLQELGLIDEDEQYTAITEAVVYIGLIVDQQGEYNDEGEEINPPTFLSGYHVDVMTNKIVNFGSKEIFPKNGKHKFST